MTTKQVLPSLVGFNSVKDMLRSCRQDTLIALNTFMLALNEKRDRCSEDDLKLEFRIFSRQLSSSEVSYALYVWNTGNDDLNRHFGQCIKKNPDVLSRSPYLVPY